MRIGVPDEPLEAPHGRILDLTRPPGLGPAHSAGHPVEEPETGWEVVGRQVEPRRKDLQFPGARARERAGECIRDEPSRKAAEMHAAPARDSDLPPVGEGAVRECRPSTDGTSHSDHVHTVAQNFNSKTKLF